MSPAGGPGGVGWGNRRPGQVPCCLLYGLASWSRAGDDEGELAGWPIQLPTQVQSQGYKVAPQHLPTYSMNCWSI